MRYSVFQGFDSSVTRGFAQTLLHFLQMNRKTSKILEDALDQYFAAFESTRELTSEFIAKRKYHVETLILLCARLDALASDAADDATSAILAVPNLSHCSGRTSSTGVGVTRAAIKQALEEAWTEFLDGDGARMKR